MPRSNHPFMRGFPVKALLLAMLCAFTASSAAAQDQEYRLGSQDKLSIRVVEWQTVEGAFREWSAVSGQYTISASGKLSLPFVGALQATGKTTEEISETIETTLQEKFGLADKPEAAVELAEYRPFYMAGDVQTPGQYPFVPDLTVVKAISIAGGLRRDSTGSRAERDLISAQGSAEALADERLRLLVKRARIEAEQQDKSEIKVPDEIASDPKLPSILAEEKAILDTRQKKLTLQLQALDDLKELLQQEIASLEKKVATQTRQVELAKEELEGVGSLAEKGLVVNTRVLTSERNIADMESKLLDFETAILTARQDISKADQDAIELQNTATSELAVERQEVEAKLIENEIELQTQRKLMSEALAQAPAAAAGNDLPEPTITIVRSVNGKPTAILADENSAVWPGDVVKVRQELPAPLQSSVGQ
ncbi:polysaccharide biosynthesis/export family protein [Chelativorans sp. AA-79]|uniref:polysaccharide biosynthesis/export family protein n=1 Tax=Chelativorans sp. AA-79 TaxID=3028735 RepID=UPI0023F82B4A|nr:polysaccharide biosynthesis/export family protein [Chelativorans sp. AA-79]WEX08170.1 polysaccharide biosynthesis/export family protein [Chelativorans sp. AA-79]